MCRLQFRHIRSVGIHIKLSDPLLIGRIFIPDICPGFSVLDLRFIAAVAWFILFSTIGGYGLYWLCLRRSSATRVGSLIYLTPPVTMIWG